MRRSTTERWLISLVLLLTTAYAVAEEITLTTYYPSPRGMYEQLRTTGQTLLAQLTDGVGIGITTPPGAKLDIGGVIRANPDASIATAPTPANARFDVGLASIVGNCPLFSSYTYWDSAANTWRYTTDNQSGFIFGGCGANWNLYTTPVPGAGAAGTAIPAANVVPSMSVTSDGKVGIGTTSPAAKLEVNMQNPAGWSGPLDALDITAPDTRFLMNLRTEVVGSGNVGYRIQTRDAGGVLHDAMTLDSFGNVGIGTTTPADKLSILNGLLRIDNPGNQITTTVGAEVVPGAVLRSVLGVPGNGSTIELVHSFQPFLSLTFETPGPPATTVTTQILANGISSPNVSADSLNAITSFSLSAGAGGGKVLISDGFGNGSWQVPTRMPGTITGGCHWANDGTCTGWGDATCPGPVGFFCTCPAGSHWKDAGFAAICIVDGNF